MSLSTTSPESAHSIAETTRDLLFQPMKMGPYTLPNRIAMAPLTRSRSRQPGNVPTPLNACYYTQRASAAFIITEATQVSLQGQGYAWTPGIHTREQVEAWRRVTDAVHQAGSLIFMQLWHVGRVSHPSLQPDGVLPVAPSAIAPSGDAFVENEQGEGALVPFVTPRALQMIEMPFIVKQFVHGARNALAAGFDGVEIHCANGYLLDQFVNSSSNQRTDDYGGSVENRARLLVEVIEAVREIWGSDRMGVRLSPLGTFNDMGDDDPEVTFGHIAERLSAYDLAYLHVVNPNESGSVATIMKVMREKYDGTLIVAGGFDREKAETWLQQGDADLVAFGRLFLANPDLPERFRQRAHLNTDDPSTYYGGGAKGYTDYPTLAQEGGEEPVPCVDERWR